MLKKILITWATQYNGISVSLADQSLNSPHYEKLCETVDHYDNKLGGEGLPSLTYELIGEELMTAVCEGDEDGNAADPDSIEYAVDDNDIKLICERAKYLFSKFSDEQFEFELVFDHFSS